MLIWGKLILLRKHIDKSLVFPSCEIWNPLTGCKPQHIYPAACLPCTHIHRETYKQYRCQAGWDYQRCASTCPTTFPRNHGNLEIGRACVVCLLAFKDLQCPSASHSLTDCTGSLWSHSTSFRSWIGSSLHGNNLFFLCGSRGSLKETRRA